MTVRHGPAGRFALRAQRLFDGERFIDSPVALIEDERITAVGADVPDDVTTHDLGAVTLLPGLVDCHQHLVFDGKGTLEEQVSGVSDADLRSRARASARRALLGGTTTLRDLGDRNYVTLDLRGDPEMPTIACAGPPITIVGGHCWYLGGEATPGDGMVTAVRERIERGCDTVKIMVTGGFLTPATPMWKSQFELEDIRTAVQEARAAGMTVAAHCHGLQGISDAIDAGVDTIEHCTFLDETMTPAPSTDLLERLAKSDTTVSATFGLTPNGAMPEAFERILSDIRSAFGEVHTRGGRVVLGSDAGIDEFKPHDVAHYSMGDFVAIGMSPVEALQALTIGGADTLKMPRKGRIVPGADADLLAVQGDPESNPADLSQVEQVWRAGRPVRESGPAFN